MYDYMIEAKKHLAELNKLLKEVDRQLARESKTLETESSEPTHVYTSLSNGCHQYYFKTGDNPRVYARVADIPRVKVILQRDYDIKVHKALVKSINTLELFIAKHDAEAIENVYSYLCEGRKRLVTPIIQPDEEFVKSWFESMPSAGNPYYDERLYETDAGEMVRSKSEKIIADMLHKNGIPYQYEPKLKFKNGYYVYPDFAVLNVKKRRTIYWEHLGMISDGEYASKALQKISDYEKNEYYLGENLILSMESETMPLNSRLIERTMEKYLL